jgi:hypothetical protein
MKVGDLVRFGEDYPDGNPYGVGMIVGWSTVGYHKDMSHQIDENFILWRVLFAKRFQGWIRTDQLRVIHEGG